MLLDNILMIVLNIPINILIRGKRWLIKQKFCLMLNYYLGVLIKILSSKNHIKIYSQEFQKGKQLLKIRIFIKELFIIILRLYYKYILKKEM